MTTIKLPFEAKNPILACGADLKGAFAFAQGDKAVLAGVFGDLADPDNLAKYEKAINKYAAKAKIIAHDLHPGYFSTQFAEHLNTKSGRRILYPVQHHEAHIASAVIDHAIKGNCVGVAFDGTGLGTDGNIWGGEFFVGNLRDMKRVARFEYCPMPGGELAIKEPWRMATSYLYHAFGNKFLKLKIGFIKKFGKRGQAPFVKKMIDKRTNSPLTSSAGRLFDGVASLVLLKDKAVFEAELPIMFEKMAIELCQDHYDYDISAGKDILVIGVAKIMRGIVKDISTKVDAATISGKFHNTMAKIIADISYRLSVRYKTADVVMSGGVFQNRYLLDKARLMLGKRGLKAYAHSKIPASDAGIPIGQVAITDARARCA